MLATNFSGELFRPVKTLRGSLEKRWVIMSNQRYDLHTHLIAIKIMMAIAQRARVEFFCEAGLRSQVGSVKSLECSHLLRQLSIIINY